MVNYRTYYGKVRLILLIICLTWAQAVFVHGQNPPDVYKVTIKWINEKPQGLVEVLNGELENMVPRQGKGKISKNEFRFNTVASNILDISLKNVKVNYGPGQHW